MLKNQHNTFLYGCLQIWFFYCLFQMIICVKKIGLAAQEEGKSLFNLPAYQVHTDLVL